MGGSILFSGHRRSWFKVRLPRQNSRNGYRERLWETRAAAIYTLLGTTKRNDLNPESYLRYVLERIADHPINQIEDILPWNLLAKMPELRIAA